jgi:hypothetical protein
VPRGNEPAKPASTDILCNGPKVGDYWVKRTITVVVRRDEIASPGLPEGMGPVNAVVTAVPRRRIWLRIIAGVPMPRDHETYLIKEGETFDPDEHCLWANRQHPMFESPGTSEAHHAGRDR